MNGQPALGGLGGDEALHQHRDLTTVLKASPWPGVPRTSSASPRVIQSGASTNSSKIQSHGSTHENQKIAYRNMPLCDGEWKIKQQRNLS